jgi:hypothetical protein
MDAQISMCFWLIMSIFEVDIVENLLRGRERKVTLSSKKWRWRRKSRLQNPSM